MKNVISNLDQWGEFFRKLARGNKFSEELNQLITDNLFILLPFTLLIKKSISGASGVHYLIDENTKLLPGISSIAGSKLPTNKGYAFDRVGLRFQASGKVNDMGSEKFDSAFSGALLNANLVVKQRGAVIMDRPVSDFYVPGTYTNPHDQYVNVDLPHVLRDNEDIEMYLHFAKGSSIAAAVDDNTHALIEVKFLGVASRRSN